MNRAALTEIRRTRGAAARKAGLLAETVAALWLMAKGWRILGMNLRSRLGEIDVLAKRGQVLAVVEVKSRASLETALASVTPDQQARLRRAGAAIAARRAGLAGLSVRLDLVALAPGRIPRHIPNAWGPTSGDRPPRRTGR